MINDYGFLIGRFQPLHAGHRSIIRQAAAKVKTLFVFVGSANVARNIKNPWSYELRKEMLLQFLNHEDIENVPIIPLNDYKYDDYRWHEDVEFELSVRTDSNDIVMFGFKKEGNDYFKYFDWPYINLESGVDVCATQIRDYYFETRSSSMPASVQKDWDYFHAEKLKYKDYPYHETLNFNCADALITYNGKVLLIERKCSPGIGNLALPGGFKNANETFYECAVREAKEETGAILSGLDFVRQRLFDNPNRGFGIPRNTMVFHFNLQEEPEVKAMDDAFSAKFYDLKYVMNCDRMHDDHLGILQEMLAVRTNPASFNFK